MMTITHANGETYRVKWVPAGFSWAIPTVYTRRRFLGVPYNKKVWEGDQEVAGIAAKLHPEDTRRKFQKAVSQYVEYREAWKNEA